MQWYIWSQIEFDNQYSSSSCQFFWFSRMQDEKELSVNASCSTFVQAKERKVREWSSQLIQDSMNLILHLSCLTNIIMKDNGKALKALQNSSSSLTLQL